MTNAVGYYHNEREERIDHGHQAFKGNPFRVKTRKVPETMDINRDFPYNLRSEFDCLNTIAGRVIHEIFT